MGYYDGEHSERSRKREKNHSGLYGFIGAVLGALIVVFSIPALSSFGFLPYDVSPSGGGQEEAEEENIENAEELIEEEIDSVSLETTSAVTEAVDSVSDAVVGIVNMNQSGGGIFDSPEGGGEGTGSGIIYKVEGEQAFVVTNQHVIEGASSGQTDVDVTLTDGSRIPAEFVGEDVLTDLAVLTIDAENVDTVAVFGDSENLRAGEPAIAIGNPLAFEGSVTLGIISAVERSIPVDLSGNGQPDWEAEVIQTDAAINPGNSGGALLNIQGEVIGINSMKIAQQLVEGIGFAIPSELALPVIEDLEQYGEVKRPQMGIALRSLQEIPSFHWESTLGLPEDIKGGVYIESVEPNTPAAEAGLQEADVIVSLDDEEIQDANELRRFLYTDVSIGDTIEVVFYRDGEQQTVELTLAEQVF
ncbi:S1C family serine protease [Alkalicoccus daliensis]|uniref:HtrA-like peptidase. Serine peptidase. MEROPS family S01B n=1 Tax=Alkalicoccus daliensis TaxID=745820 RepID=A0A1H0FQV0_9BACI|nr:trypsin-like peptidase domain-containing protein [Alkalicoccus daliensis]SDN97063.1 htrA-like peptidase. Serine peptidase. MEROPS family S01B [Alkalicoccus daliensis]